MKDSTEDEFSILETNIVIVPVGSVDDIISWSINHNFKWWNWPK